MGFSEFRDKVKRIATKKKFKVTNSNGTKEAWRWFKKNKWFGKGAVTEREFGIIVKTINNYYRKRLLEKKDITLPYHFGSLQIRKYKTYLKLQDDKVVNNYPINWNKTLKLWYEDDDAKREKIVIKSDSPYVYKIFYMKRNAFYKNKTFYTFAPTRSLKHELSNLIVNDLTFDTFIIK